MQLHASMVWRQVLYIAISLQFLGSEKCHATNIPTIFGLGARQSSANPGTKSFLRRGFQASIVAGHYLYIDGGDYSIYENNRLTISYASTTLSIDLSQDWVNSTVTFQSSPKPAGCPSLTNPSLWYYEAGNVLYTGFTGGPSSFANSSQSLPDPSIWSFALNGQGTGTWSQAISPNDKLWSTFHQPTPNNAFQASGTTDAYILGGNDQSPGVSLPHYVRFDMKSQTLTNTSGAPYDNLGGAQRGTLTHVPSFGSQDGIYISMGGFWDDNKSGLLGFNYVSVFDPVQQAWYNQSTTGFPPAGRIEFCSAGIASSNQTFEIFVYAGWGTELGTDAIQYDTISILTLPAFNWFQVPYNPENPRYGLSCNAVGGSQIVSVGGADANSNVTTGDTRYVFTSQDPFTQGLAIFDMTALRWADKYTANAPPYVQSDMVKQFYTSNNGAYLSKLGAPVKNLMSQKNFATSTTSTTSSPTSSNTPASSSAAPNTGASAGTIAGSVIGALALLAIVVAAIVFLLRRRQNRRKQQYLQTPNHDYDSPPRNFNSSPGLQEVPADSRPVELQDQDPLKKVWEAPADDVQHKKYAKHLMGSDGDAAELS